MKTQINPKTEDFVADTEYMLAGEGSLFMKSGEKVEQGQPLLTLEAMKMEHTLSSPMNGVVGPFDIQLG